MATKKEQSEAIQLLKSYLCEAGRSGKQTVVITRVGGGATDSGRTDYYNIHVWGIGHDGRPAVMGFLNRLFTIATSYRLNQKRDAVTVTGCGTDKGWELAADLALIAGHDIHVQGAWSGWATKP